MSTSDYRFTFADFRTNRSLSHCTVEPPIAGYIRWLRSRAERLLPETLEIEHIELCNEWWPQVVADEFHIQRELGRSPHAVFDFGPDDERVMDKFPSDTDPIFSGEWSDYILGTDTPNPVKKSRKRREDGSLHRITLYLHQVLSLIALSDLSHAIQMLIVGSVDETPPNVRLLKEREAMTLVVGATELVNRAECHALAKEIANRSKKLLPVVGSKSKSPLENSSPSKSVACRIQRKEIQQATRQKLRKNEARIIQHKSFLEIEFGGECKYIDGITYKRGLTLGFSCLIGLLESRPCEEIDLLILAKNYQNSATPEHFAGEMQEATHDAIRNGSLTSHGSPNGEKLQGISPKLVAILQQKKDAEDAGDKEKAEALEAKAEELYKNEQEKENNCHSGRNTTKIGKQSAETLERNAIQKAGKALERALIRLEKDFPALGAHLRKSIPKIYGRTIAYRSSPCIRWIIEEGNHNV